MYATAADVTARFGAAEITRTAESDSAAAAKVTTALADAAADIDTRIASAYALPLTGSYPLLTSIQCDLARKRLYDEQPPKAVNAAAERALKQLDDLAAGDLTLVDSSGAVVPRKDQARQTGGAAQTDFEGL